MEDAVGARICLSNVEAIFHVVKSAITAPPQANQHSTIGKISTRIVSYLLAASGTFTATLLVLYGGFRVFNWHIPSWVLWGMLALIDGSAFAAISIEGATSILALLRISRDPVSRQLALSLLQLEHDIKYLSKLVVYPRLELLAAKNYLEKQLDRFDAVRSAFAGPVAKVGLLPVAIGFAAVAPKIKDAVAGSASAPTVSTVLIACAAVYVLTWATQKHPMRLGLGVNLLQQAIDLQEESKKSNEEHASSPGTSPSLLIPSLALNRTRFYWFHWLRTIFNKP